MIWPTIRFGLGLFVAGVAYRSNAGTVEAVTIWCAASVLICDAVIEAIRYLEERK